MKAYTQINVDLKPDEGGLSPFFPLLQKGFAIKARAGSSIKNLLCEQLGVDADYFEDRIQTIFLDGKPVDDAETAIVRDGCTVALSAAMPGLVGSTFRRGGALAAFRNGITHRERTGIFGMEGDETVTVKLFNLLIGELGPVFLQEGIWIHHRDAKRALRDLSESPFSCVELLEKDGREIPLDPFAALDWPEEPGDVLLRVTIEGRNA